MFMYGLRGRSVKTVQNGEPASPVPEVPPGE